MKKQPFEKYSRGSGVFKSYEVLINPIVQTYNVSYMGASSLPGACCLGMTIGMAFGPVLISKASLRRLTYIVSWIPAGCWLLMFAFLDFTVVIVSFLMMAIAWGVIYIMFFNGISMHFDENRTLATQIGTLGASVGQFALPVVITALITGYSLQAKVTKLN